MHLVPVGFRNQPVGKLSLSSGLTTIASTSLATAGTGLVRIPVYAWISAAGTGAFACYNGTAGSVLFQGKVLESGPTELYFWESPGALAQGKPLVIETTGEVGAHSFHVYFVVARGGVGAGALVQ